MWHPLVQKEKCYTRPTGAWIGFRPNFAFRWTRRVGTERPHRVRHGCADGLCEDRNELEGVQVIQVGPSPTETYAAGASVFIGVCETVVAATL